MTTPQHSKHHLRNKLASWSRWLHIYLSMVSFVIVFFFAVTGLTLNHTEWFSGQERIAQLKGSVETKWIIAIFMCVRPGSRNDETNQGCLAL